MKELRHSLIPVFFIAVSLQSLAGCGKLLSIRDRIKGPEIKRTQVEDVAVGTEPLNWKDTEFEAFTESVQGLMQKRDFASLDALASEFRGKKERFQRGGGWKIHSFYTLTAAPYGHTDDEWERHIRFLEEWKAAMPASIAARASLSNALLGYAWKARGVGYAHEIPPDALSIFESRMEQTAAELLEASQLEERCYGYYEVVLDFARGGGFDRGSFDKFFAEANAYDKTYQYFYLGKAEYLLPRWFGQEGELAKFSESLLQSLGEVEGLKLYYLIVGQIADYKWETNLFESNGLSWTKTKKGFVLFERDHGMTRYRLNQFAHLTIAARDAQTACSTFKRLQGENDFDPGLWKDRKGFEEKKKLVLEIMCNKARYDNQID